MKTEMLTIKSLAMIGILLLVAGCDSRDARLERVVDETMEQQAAQNAQMARLHQNVADGTQKLIEADAKARQELVAMQRELRGDQAIVGQQRDLLEVERKNLTAERQRDQLLAVAVENVGLMVACAAPLLLAAYAIFVAARTPADKDVTDVLIREIASDQPNLLRAPALLALPTQPDPSVSALPEESS